jgi:hypothetical protein
MIIPEKDITGAGAYELAISGVFSADATFTGVVVYDLVSYTGTYIFTIQDLAGVILAQSAVLSGSSTNAVATGTTLTAGTSGGHSIPFVKVVVNLGVGSGILRLRAARLLSSV